MNKQTMLRAPLWKCGKCKKEYKSLLDLEFVKAVDSDKDPKNEHGYVSKCTCGYVFHKDKWQLKDVLKLRKKNFIGFYYDFCKVKISTIDLELRHFDFWYETMVFVDWSIFKNIRCYYQKRHRTQREAKRWHKYIVNKLKNDDYEIVPANFEGTFWEKLKCLFYRKQELRL